MAALQRASGGIPLSSPPPLPNGESRRHPPLEGDLKGTASTTGRFPLPLFLALSPLRGPESGGSLEEEEIRISDLIAVSAVRCDKFEFLKIKWWLFLIVGSLS